MAPPTIPTGDSAKVLLRLPRDLHAQAKQMASEQGVSLNTFLATVVAGAVGYRDPGKRLQT